MSLLSTKSEWCNKKVKTKTYNTFPPPLPASWAQLHSQFSLPPPPEQRRGSAGRQGVGVTVSPSHVVSAAPASSAGGLLTLCPFSSMGSLPWDTVIHELLQRESFPQATVLHELLQRGSLPQGAVLQEQAAPAWVCHGVTNPARKPALAWAPLSMGLQVLPGACSSTGSPPGIPVLWRGIFHGLQVEICSTMGLRGLQGDSLPHHSLLHGLQGNICPVPGAPPPPPSSLTLVPAELFLSHFLTPLSGFCHSIFPPS